MRGFGIHFDFESGTTRNWHIGEDGVKRWSDTNEEYVEPQRQDNQPNEQG